MKNRWLDADGKVYIYFSQEQIAEMMGCGLKKVGSLLAELDSRKGIGLITRIRQGLGKPDRIYVRRCICVDLSEGNIQTCQNDISGYIKMADTDMSKVPGNDTDKNKTEINDTEYLSFLSADESEESRRKQIEREAYYKIIGEWERTIDGKKQMFSCPMVVDMELFQKAQKSLTHRSIRDSKSGGASTVR